jgi:hypothetical protein
MAVSTILIGSRQISRGKSASESDKLPKLLSLPTSLDQNAYTLGDVNVY